MLFQPPLVLGQGKEFTDYGGTFSHPIPPQGYFTVGSAFQIDNTAKAPCPEAIPSKLSSNHFCVKTGSDPDAIAEPIDYWNLRVLESNISFWLPVPPAGYVSLGVVVSHGETKPTTESHRCVCVKRCYIVPASISKPFWSDGKNEFALIESLDPHSRGLAMGAFGVVGYCEYFCLDAAHVNGPGSPDMEELQHMITAFGPRYKIAKGEQYFPTSVEWFVPRCNLKNVKTGKISYPVQVKDLPCCEKSNKFVLDLEDPETSRGGDISKAKAYVHVKKLDEIYTDIQFWIFYAYRGPSMVQITSSFMPKFPLGAESVGEREGDWKHVTLRFNNYNKEKPHSVFMSQHGSGVWLPYEQCEVDPGTKQISVYASLYDHGSYPYPGEYQHLLRSEKIFDDDISLTLRSCATVECHHILDCATGFEIINADYLLDSTAPTEPQWMKFRGEIGAKNVFTSAVVSPSFFPSRKGGFLKCMLNKKRRRRRKSVSPQYASFDIHVSSNMTILATASSPSSARTLRFIAEELAGIRKQASLWSSSVPPCYRIDWCGPEYVACSLAEGSDEDSSGVSW